MNNLPQKAPKRSESAFWDFVEPWTKKMIIIKRLNNSPAWIGWGQEVRRTDCPPDVTHIEISFPPHDFFVVIFAKRKRQKSSTGEDT